MERAEHWVQTPEGVVQNELEALTIAYAQVCSERDRLRDARGYFARPLGPAPLSTGISTALVSVFGSHLHVVFVVFAALTVLALVVVGAWYDGKPAYRHLLARAVDAEGADEKPSGALGSVAGETAAGWLRQAIAREEAIMGAPEMRNRWRTPWAPVRTLQDGVDSERTGLRVVQVLWLLAILFLLLSAA